MSKNDKLSEYDYNKVPTKEIISDKQDVPIYGYGVRHIQLAIFLLCLTVNFLARGHLGVTVVAMTTQPKYLPVLNTNLDVRLNNAITDDINITNYEFHGTVSENKSEEEVVRVDVHFIKAKYNTYNWEKSTQEMVLGSFFIGYCIMMFPIGMVCQRWGGKLPLQVALFVNGIVSILTPWLTNWGGWKAVCCCRILQGLAQSGTYPSIQTLLARWVPASERAKLTSYVYTGTSIGNIVAFQLGGLLGDSRWGWPSTFWVVGIICLISFIILTIFGAATPKEHKRISEEEKNYILGRLDDGNVRKPRTPWKAILTSKHMWGTTVTHVASGVSFVFFFNQVPSYIHHILGINVKSSGLLSSLPYIGGFFSSIAFGLISDYCTNYKIVSLKNSRRISNSIAQLGIAFALIGVSYTSNTAVAVVCLVIAMSSHMGIHTGWMVNHIDLAPNFSGTLMAIGNTLMNIFTVLLPVLISYVVTDVKNLIQWRIMFFIIAGCCIVCNAIFVLLMSSETQHWNYYDQNEICIEDTKLEDITENKEKQ